MFRPGLSAGMEFPSTHGGRTGTSAAGSRTAAALDELGRANASRAQVDDVLAASGLAVAVNLVRELADGAAAGTAVADADLAASAGSGSRDGEEASGRPAPVDSAGHVLGLRSVKFRTSSLVGGQDSHGSGLTRKNSH
jgi:hypothetical protein